MASVPYHSSPKTNDHGTGMAITVGITGSDLQDKKLQQFTLVYFSSWGVKLLMVSFSSGFQRLVREYKNLPTPSTITVELESSVVIEAQDAPFSELDPTTVRQYLRRPTRLPGKGKNIGHKKEDCVLVLDFRYATETTFPAPPRVSTTYRVRNMTAVPNEWHFMLTKCPAYGFGIFIYVPGTSLRYFIDMVIDEDHTTKSYLERERECFQFPLDLIAWQLFDFFVHRIVGEKFNTERGFAPLSLCCPDQKLVRFLSRLFSNLGLSKEREIKRYRCMGIPVEYEEQHIFLPNRHPEWLRLRDLSTVLICLMCNRFFISVNLQQVTCMSCRNAPPINLGWKETGLFKCRMALQLPPLYFAKETTYQIDKRKKVSEEVEEPFNGKRLRKTPTP